MSYKYIKRFFDFTFSLLLLIILSPLFLILIILLGLTGEGKIFYLQNRVGYKNEMFKIWKFATMLKNSLNMGTGSLTLRNDPRVTRVGKFLRITKVNELPQIINVLIGNMSFVGPRPQMKVDYEAYSTEIQSKIYNVKPGITGIGSIIFRDEEKLISDYKGDPRQLYETVIAPYKGELEMWYQKKISFSTDIKILFITVWVVLFPKTKLLYSLFKNLPVLKK